MMEKLMQASDVFLIIRLDVVGGSNYLLNEPADTKTSMKVASDFHRLDKQYMY